MKIIRIDNFNRDYVSDKLIAENVNNHYGKHIVRCLNDRFGGDNSLNFFKLVEDDYKLHIFEA